MIVGRYSDLEAAVSTMGLERAWEVAALCSGHELMQLLELPRGPAVGLVKQQQEKWQLEHPTGVAEECGQFLKQWWAEQ